MIMLMVAHILVVFYVRIVYKSMSEKFTIRDLLHSIREHNKAQKCQGGYSKMKKADLMKFVEEQGITKIKAPAQVRGQVTVRKLRNQQAGLQGKNTKLKKDREKLDAELKSWKGVRTKEATRERKRIKKEIEDIKNKFNENAKQFNELKKQIDELRGKKITPAPKQVKKISPALGLKQKAPQQGISSDKLKKVIDTPIKKSFQREPRMKVPRGTDCPNEVNMKFKELQKNSPIKKYKIRELKKIVGNLLLLHQKCMTQFGGLSSSQRRVLKRVQNSILKYTIDLLNKNNRYLVKGKKILKVGTINNNNDFFRLEDNFRRAIDWSY